MPSKAQIDTQRNVSSFSPTIGGRYANSALTDEDTRGYWWASEAASNDANRYRLVYNGSSLVNGSGNRRMGLYIRCVNKQKTVLDLTYMQEMTPETF